MELVFNERSADALSQTTALARERMSKFVALVRAAHRLGIKKTLCVPRHLRQTTLAPSYVIEQWLRDTDAVIKEEIQYFLMVATKGPYLEQIWQVLTEHNSFECRFAGQVAYGLGVAFLLPTFAIGLGTTDDAISTVAIDVAYIDGNDVVGETVDIRCMTRTAHLEEFEPFIRNALEAEYSIAHGRDLWHRRSELYPGFQFCESARESIEALGANDPKLNHLVRHLGAMKDCFGSWVSGNFSLTGVEWSYESGQTMAHITYGPMRNFVCPDGTTRSFSAHSKIRAFNLRIYFHAEMQGTDRVLFIGYFGPHLPTQKFPT